MLTPQQNRHIDTIIDAFVDRALAKYEAGAEEHGGNLWDKDPLHILNEAIDEAVDQFIYLTTLKQKLEKETADGLPSQKSA